MKSEKLDQLEQRESELTRQLMAVRAEYKVEILRLIEEKYGVKVGSVVVTDKGETFRVVEIATDRLYGKGKPWVSGNIRKKDGSFGTAVRNLFDYWQLAEQPDSQQ